MKRKDTPILKKEEVSTFAFRRFCHNINGGGYKLKYF
jgi:hypothetical protein